jgi:hypothetical protein
MRVIDGIVLSWVIGDIPSSRIWSGDFPSACPVEFVGEAFQLRQQFRE